jgi:GNAT superfamily N-acetyltransferase
VTVVLRPVTRSDDRWFETWLPAIVLGAGYPPEAQRKARRLTIALATAGAAPSRGEPAGVISYRLRAPRRGEATCELIALAPPYSRRGVGMHAVALLEERVRRAGARRMFAPAEEKHGIAMYFWIRLGYRPLRRDEWPCVLPGVAWLVRDL